jgi:hypothetical protein
MEGHAILLHVAFLHRESALRTTDDQVGPIGMLEGFLVCVTMRTAVSHLNGMTRSGNQVQRTGI